MNEEFVEVAKSLLVADDVSQLAELLSQNPGAVRKFLETEGSTLHILEHVQSPKMAEHLLRIGLTTERISKDCRPGFGLNRVSKEVAEFLLTQGVQLSPHAAAALGLVKPLAELLQKDPSIVHAKGGDGARPLHFARNMEIAQLLVTHGAELDPRDDDHDSTPAQWRIRESPDVTHFLLAQGAKPDVFMAAGLGDLHLAKTMVAQNPACTGWRIGNNSGPFPALCYRNRGGTIYQWTLGFNQSPHEIAFHRGHSEVFDFLWSRTEPRHQILVAATLADRPRAESVVRDHADVMATLDDEARMLPAKFCWETNKNVEAVRLMLDLGFPNGIRENAHGYMPLHNAAWCGDPDLVQLLLERGHPVEPRDPAYKATALGYALHSCLVAKRHPKGRFPEVIQLLLKGGVPMDPDQYPTGVPELDRVIEATIRRSI